VNQIAAPTTQRPADTPLPNTDRGALSEAWYRALYRTSPSASNTNASNARRPSAPAPDSAASRAQPDASRTNAAEARSVARATPRAQRSFTFALAAPRPDRPAAPSPQARAWRLAVAKRLTYRLTLADGKTVDVLVQQRGRRMHAAIAPGGRTALAAAALQRARAALLAYGVRLDTGVDSPAKGRS
jgi:hypothetical protein